MDTVLVECAMSPRDDIAEKLGIEKNGHHVKVDDFGRTNVKGVYSAGDQQSPMQAVILSPPPPPLFYLKFSFSILFIFHFIYPYSR